MLPIAHRYQNHLLLGLPEGARSRVSRYLEWVSLSAGQILSEACIAPRYAYFPADCVVSLQCATEHGETAEVAAVGNEGMLDVSLFLGGNVPEHRALVRSAGHAYRCSPHLLKGEFDSSTTLQQVLLRYSQSLLTQMAQTAVCNRYHSVSQQLCRWLLLDLDRSQLSDLTMTQDSIAQMLGVRREGITEAAGKLRSQGIIEYRRGSITVLDRAALEKLTCDCYAVFARATHRMLPSCREVPREAPRVTRPYHSMPIGLQAAQATV